MPRPEWRALGGVRIGLGGLWEWCFCKDQRVKLRTSDKTSLVALIITIILIITITIIIIIISTIHI